MSQSVSAAAPAAASEQTTTISPGQSQSLGLARGCLALLPPDPAWTGLAQATLLRLRQILGDHVLEIQHVGSTAIWGIRAKPILDFVVGVQALNDIKPLVPALQAQGFIPRPWPQDQRQLFFACGDYSQPRGLQTHFIHVVVRYSDEWRQYVDFRDYLNARPSQAQAYEALKLSLAQRFSQDPDRSRYLAGKSQFIQQILRRAALWRWLGQQVTVTVDRPAGTYHPEHPGLYYPLNYGYLPGQPGGDGEALDAYVLGPTQPLEQVCGRVIAGIYRHDDQEDKLVVLATDPGGCDRLPGAEAAALAPADPVWTPEAILSAVSFQERYFDGEIIC
ncbi:hypothetical protein HCH52_10985 [Oscillospiraceae bacterium HV4-5-C5C]|nr:hypothetical protein [Oscillospiraceae bacterium HV4-5-C5C]